MYKIVEKKVLNPTVIQLWIEAPLVANKARPGQFIILRVDEDGERIPLTVAGVNKDNGTVKIIDTSRIVEIIKKGISDDSSCNDRSEMPFYFKRKEHL